MNSSLAKQVTGVRLCLGMYPLWKPRTFTVSRELLSFPWVLLLTESVSCLLSRSPVCHWHHNYPIISASISHPDLKLKLLFLFFSGCHTWDPNFGIMSIIRSYEFIDFTQIASQLNAPILLLDS